MLDKTIFRDADDTSGHEAKENFSSSREIPSFEPQIAAFTRNNCENKHFEIHLNRKTQTEVVLALAVGSGPPPLTDSHSLFAVLWPSSPGNYTMMPVVDLARWQLIKSLPFNYYGNVSFRHGTSSSYFAYTSQSQQCSSKHGGGHHPIVRELHQVRDDSPERSILARLILSNQQVEADPLEELHGLATTAGTEVMDELVQRRPSADHSTYLGKGKVEELRLMVERHDADLVIFDNDLSPAQTRNLEKAVGAKVLDRTELILDIFAAGARTYESRLAIELAQLEYSLPRLKRMWTHLSRQAMGVGMRGPGEKQLEVDRRLAQKRIHDLKQELSKVEQRRERQVKARKESPTVSLVGYTNAGKSTLMNALTEADVLAEDKLFATLDTRTRRWQLPGWGTVLLSDTVGFIRDVPHSLVASFKSTLEETRQAELLLHVADASSPTVFNQISAVYSVLTDLGIEEKDTLLILNKIDAIRDPATLNRVLDRYPNAITVSARSSKGLTLLTEAVGEALGREFLDLEIDVDATDGRLLAFLAAKGEVVSQTCNETTITVRVRMPTGAMGQVHRSALAIRPAVGDLMFSDLVSSDMAADSTSPLQPKSTGPDQNDANPRMPSVAAEPTAASKKHSDSQYSETSDGVPVTDNPVSDNSTEVA